jgi:hypothetical protein
VLGVWRCVGVSAHAAIGRRDGLVREEHLFMKSVIKHGAALAFVVTSFAVVGPGCLTRPVTTSLPTTKTNFTSVVRNQVIDKIDMLFDIDNSASMGDKQSYLIQAIPDLISRLVNPNCVDPNNNNALIGPSTNGTCATGQLEFPPVHDMHLGIVTSSLGSRLSEPGTAGVCDPAQMAPMPFQNLSAHTDDRGELISRSLNFTANNATATESTVAHAQTGNYLYWFPTSNKTAPVGPVAPETTIGANGTANTLIGDFASMVGGAGIFGCGIESQLESWYRFLVQPDPYDTLQASSASVAPKDMWVNVDTTVLKERRDFLRPDSLVAIIVLTDENDSEIDVRSLGGQGYFFMRTGFQPPRGTSQCLANPADPNCTTCSDPSKASDSNCQKGPYKAPNDWGYDMNLRHVHMKAKYGLDPQYPIQRYVIGLTQAVVPDRHGEYEDAMGNSTSNYIGRNDCTNPLFAAGPLPDGSQLTQAALCNLPVGTRTPDLVFYAVIGGVPNQLLHFKPGDALGSQLSDADWTRILGKDPLSFNYNGIDPHMIEDYQDRTAVIAANGYPFTIDSSGTNNLSPSSSAPNTPDPVNGREWVTDQEMTPNTHVLRVDRQYACTFPLVNPATGQPAPRDCSTAAPQNSNSCDCPSTAGGLTPAQTPPLCNGTNQIAAKAYPTIRELEVAHLMGNQGIVSSLCPIHVSDMMGGNDPLFGYRPAVAVIIDRLKNALTNQCLPQKLTTDVTAPVPCLILVTLPGGSSGPGGSCTNPNCDPNQGLSVPDQGVLQKFCSTQEAAFNAAGGAKAGLPDPANQSVCQLAELINNAGTNTPGVIYNAGNFDNTGSCATSTQAGWCYVEGGAAKGCAQAIVFANGSPPAGSTSSLQCIEQSCKNAMQPCVLDSDCCAPLTCQQGACQ